MQIEAVRHNKPWDKPLYCNTIYPFCDYSKGVQWPNVIQPRPADYTFANMPNPVGSYRREFTLPHLGRAEMYLFASMEWKQVSIFG